MLPSTPGSESQWLKITSVFSDQDPGLGIRLAKSDQTTILTAPSRGDSGGVSVHAQLGTPQRRRASLTPSHTGTQRCRPPACASLHGGLRKVFHLIFVIKEGPPLFPYHKQIVCKSQFWARDQILLASKCQPPVLRSGEVREVWPGAGDTLGTPAGPHLPLQSARWCPESLAPCSA